ncbi:33K [Simian adenovirus 13]|uniref:33K n=1 Tax=Simian adenovirus 13 TaxID=38432 RepID=A0A0M4MQJ2_9ADEN|nr:33K [Simian adenovirus 13]ALE30369.1 33K [Simian adenovirus 13]
MPPKKRSAALPLSKAVTAKRPKQRKAQETEEPWSEEEDWESQGEEDMEEEWDSLASDEGEAEAETEEASVAKPSLAKRVSNVTTTSDQRTVSRRWDSTNAAPAGKTLSLPKQNKKQVKEPPSTKELRNRIFPTLYAIFQQSRGQEPELKIKNRSLRSLTRSCLYHKNEEQLQRTLDDAEALFNKYCAATLKE